MNHINPMKPEQHPVLTPNGVRDYSETLFEITSLYCDYLRENPGAAPADSRDRVNLCIELAEIFETKNAGREWDGEWLEEVEEFFAKEILAR